MQAIRKYLEDAQTGFGFLAHTATPAPAIADIDAQSVPCGPCSVDLLRTVPGLLKVVACKLLI